MGFSYRKSFKAGPIRITTSKSGISYSAGVKGARITKRADGRVQTSASIPGTGLRYTSTSTSTSTGKKQVANEAQSANKPTNPLLRPAALETTYRVVYADAVRQLRDCQATGAQLRGGLHGRGLAHPRILKAVTDAEKYLAKEAAGETRQRARVAKAARTESLAAEAAQRLRDGVPYHHVTRWLKRDHGVGFIARGEVMSKAQKINKW